MKSIINFFLSPQAVVATTGDAESQRMRQQLQFWHQLRQDLERARLLAELTRKRERVKRKLFHLFVDELELQLCPLVVLLTRVLKQLQVRFVPHCVCVCVRVLSMCVSI